MINFIFSLEYAVVIPLNDMNYNLSDLLLPVRFLYGWKNKTFETFLFELIKECEQTDALRLISCKHRRNNRLYCRLFSYE